MNLENSQYLNIYRKNLPKINIKQLNRDEALKMAINLGQVHNLLGVIISDTINLLGRACIKNDGISKSVNSVGNQQSFTNIFENNKGQENSFGSYAKNITESKIQKKQEFGSVEKMEIEEVNVKTISEKDPNYFLKNQANQPSSSCQIQVFCPNNPSKDVFLSPHLSQKNQKIVPQSDLNQSFPPTQKKPVSSSIFDFDQYKFDINQTCKQQQTKQKTRSGQCSKRLKSSKTELYSPVKIDKKQTQNLGTGSKSKKQKKEYKSVFDYLYQSSQTQSFEIQHESHQDPEPVQEDDQLPSQIDHSSIVQPSPPYSEGLKVPQYPSVISISSPSNSSSPSFNPRHINAYPKRNKTSPNSSFVNQFEDQYITSRVSGVRKKKDRQNLKGSKCPDCHAFYQAIKTDIPDANLLCQCSSRHRSNTAFMAEQLDNSSQAIDLD